MRNILIKLFSLSLIFLFVPNQGFALREIQKPTSSIVKQSSDIVVAKCISKETRKDTKYNYVFTYVTFKIEENVKEIIGSDKLVLRMPGGIYDGVLVDVPGVPKFDMYKEYIIFLGDKNTDGYYTLQSATQGVLKVVNDVNTKSRIVVGNTRDITIYRSNTSRIISDDKVSLSDFIYSLKKLQ